MSILDEHVERFSAGVRSGDFGPMVEQFRLKELGGAVRHGPSVR